MVLSTHRKRQRAQDERKRWLRIQDIWDTAFERARGYRPEPEASQVYKVRKVRNKDLFRVVFHDPTL